MRTFSPWRSGTSVPLHFDWSFDYYPREYVRPGTEVTVYRLRDCTPSTAAFPPSFRNPYPGRAWRGRGGTAVARGTLYATP